MNYFPFKRDWLLHVLSIFLFISCSHSADKPAPKPPSTGCISGKGITDIDGNAYSSVIIGTQEWMAENLTVTRYRNGDAIGNITNSTDWINLTTGGWCYYNNDISNNATYGKLYNWYAVNDSRGLAPVGWHTPSDAEWTILTNFLGGSFAAGGPLKEAGYTHWANDVNGNDSSCFDALPGGNINSGSFIMITFLGAWWSSSDAASAGAYWFALNYNNNYTDRGTAPKITGYSIRCIKN